MFYSHIPSKGRKHQYSYQVPTTWLWFSSLLWLQSCHHCWYLSTTCFYSHFPTIILFFWSIINTILFLLLLLFCCKRLREELHVCSTCIPYCPSLMADFPNMTCHIIWGFSKHIALRSHYQCNWHSRVSWRVTANPTLSMYINFLSPDTQIQLKIHSKM